MIPSPFSVLFFSKPDSPSKPMRMDVCTLFTRVFVADYYGKASLQYYASEHKKPETSCLPGDNYPGSIHSEYSFLLFPAEEGDVGRQRLNHRTSLLRVWLVKNSYSPKEWEGEGLEFLNLEQNDYLSLFFSLTKLNFRTEVACLLSTYRYLAVLMEKLEI